MIMIYILGTDTGLSPAVEFNQLLTRLENVTARLEKTVSASDPPKQISHSNSSCRK